MRFEYVSALECSRGLWSLVAEDNEEAERCARMIVYILDGVRDGTGSELSLEWVGRGETGTGGV